LEYNGTWADITYIFQIRYNHRGRFVIHRKFCFDVRIILSDTIPCFKGLTKLYRSPKQVSMLHLRDSSLIPVLQIPQPQARGFLIVIRLQNILIRDLDDLVSSGRGNDRFDVTLTQRSPFGLQGSYRLIYLVKLGLIFIVFGFRFYWYLR